jgi:hypothetical protein
MKKNHGITLSWYTMSLLRFEPSSLGANLKCYHYTKLLRRCVAFIPLLCYRFILQSVKGNKINLNVLYLRFSRGSLLEYNLLEGDSFTWEVHRCFGGTYCVLLQGWRMKQTSNQQKAVRIRSYHTTWLYSTRSPLWGRNLLFSNFGSKERKYIRQ